MDNNPKPQRKTRYTGFYFVLAFLFVLVGFLCIWEAGTTMFTERDYWDTVRSQLVTDSLPIPAHRGVIYSADGEVLSTTLPEYRICMDYVVKDRDTLAMRRAQQWRDSVFDANLDTIADGLARIFPDYTAAHFREHLLKGKANRRRNWKVYPHRVTYIQYKACKELPLFRERPYKGGFYAEELPQRKKPYGSLAGRTIGAMYASKDSARYGLELSFDSILRGTPGIKHVTKVRNRRLSFVDQPPVDGHDLLTTIDIGVQDAAEKSLVSKLREIGGDMGVVIVMEVKTGDVKAIVNMARCRDGQFREIKNSALLDRMEPGSTFKTASILCALNDGVIKLTDVADCAPGIKMMHGRPMKDHNWHRGGYGTLSVVESLMYSSNIAVSTFIDKHYFDCPEKYVDGLHRMGVGEPLNLPFQGSVEPIVRRPIRQGRDWKNWSKTALAWMSIGYETQVTPLNTLAFYNAIANDGRFVKPRFVKAEMVNGEVVREFPTEVLREKIANDQALADIRYCLEKVVSEGLGKKAGNKRFKVSGKTGTAQVADEHGGYHSGIPRYLISFCGFFPSDAPQYSCIVAIRKTGLPASGGGHCGPVFSEVSQVVMAKGVFRDPADAADSTSVFTPHEKATQPALSRPSDDKLAVMPDLTGMGMRTAVNTLRQLGLRARVVGVGAVRHQSVQKDVAVKPGTVVRIELG
ncbi:MAG: transpeptidase family protein [Bacteroidaceae bacterium]|nr:transpeptidase family protein [Bacteroidaceae bacterium]